MAAKVAVWVPTGREILVYLLVCGPFILFTASLYLWWGDWFKQLGLEGGLGASVFLVLFFAAVVPGMWLALRLDDEPQPPFED